MHRHTYARAHKHTHTHRAKSEADFILTSLTFHPEHSLKEKKSKRLQARKKDRFEGWKGRRQEKINGEERGERDTEKKKNIKRKRIIGGEYCGSKGEETDIIHCKSLLVFRTILF